MAPFDLYKPFRNFIRQFPLEESLVVVWWYTQHVTEDLELPDNLTPRDPFGRLVDVKRFIHVWDLEILAKEVVLNAQPTGQRSFGTWNDLARAINWIRDLSAKMDPVDAPDYNVLREVLRIIHQQFPWQAPASAQTLTRYFKIFGGPEMSPLVEREFGMTPWQLVRVAFAIASRYRANQGSLATQDYTSIGVSDEIRDAFLDRVAQPIDRLRDQTRAKQSYGRDWVYSFNPLRGMPLIRYDLQHPERLLCPMPALLHRRFTDGLYYDLIRQPGIENALGFGFQRYVGDVLAAAFLSPGVEIIAEKEYLVSKDRKDGVDWIVQDDGATLFIECKTKRMTMDAKFGADGVALADDIRKMAINIAKVYANIVDALAGRTQWSARQGPAFALICTMEDWWLLGAPGVEGLHEAVCTEMTARSLDLGLLDRIPYAMASIAEMETGFQLINRMGILAFMTPKFSEAHRLSSLGPYFKAEFPEEARTARGNLFPDDFNALFSDIPGIDLP